MASANSSHLLVTGDFNYPDIDWCKWTTRKAESRRSQQLIDVLRNNFLSQHIDNPTRYRPGQQPSVLDLVITNEEGMVDGIQHKPWLGKSDHECLHFDFQISTDSKTTRTVKPNYHKGNYDEMKRELNKIEWKRKMNLMDATEALEFFTNQLNSITKEHIPAAKKKSKKKKIWMTRDGLAKHKKKYSAWKSYKETNDYTDYIRYTKERRELKTLTKKLCHDFGKNLANNIK